MARSLTPAQIRQRYGKEAYTLLTRIKRGEVRKRRRTILALADAVLLGTPRTEVYAEETCLNKRTHFRCLRDDDDYRNAYMHIVGNEEHPGIARRLFLQIVDEETGEAISVLNNAVNLLVDGSYKAALALLESLDAEEMKLDMRGNAHYAPDNRTRLAAAKTLFDLTKEWRAPKDEGADDLKLIIELPDNMRQSDREDQN